jgi:hypothetical protein
MADEEKKEETAEEAAERAAVERLRDERFAALVPLAEKVLKRNKRDGDYAGMQSSTLKSRMCKLEEALGDADWLDGYVRRICGRSDHIRERSGRGYERYYYYVPEETLSRERTKRKAEARAKNIRARFFAHPSITKGPEGYRNPDYIYLSTLGFDATARSWRDADGTLSVEPYVNEPSIEGMRTFSLDFKVDTNGWKDHTRLFAVLDAALITRDMVRELYREDPDESEEEDDDD